MVENKPKTKKATKPSNFGIFIHITFISSFNKMVQSHNKRKLKRLIKKQDQMQLDNLK